MEAASPVFICAACGYLCEETWAEVDPWEEVPCLEYLLGLVQMAAARRSKPMTLCFHPDGTGDYGGAEVGNLKGTHRTVASDEARELVANAEPISDVLSLHVLEDAVLMGMAGLMAENGLTYVSPDIYPDDFGRIYDRLANLPETSAFASMYAEGDPTLKRLQDIVAGLLGPETALREALYDKVTGEQHHIFAPQDLQALIDATRP
jgi:hypothetical protein